MIEKLTTNRTSAGEIPAAQLVAEKAHERSRQAAEQEESKKRVLGDNSRASRTGETAMRKRFERKRQPADHDEIANDATHNRNDRARQEGILHKTVGEDLLQIRDEIPARGYLHLAPKLPQRNGVRLR
jgi:hypothetical protein